MTAARTLTAALGDMRPGKQGVALRLELLPELRQALADAESEAERQGLMPEGAAA